MQNIATAFFLTLFSFIVSGQSIDASFSRKKMKKDLEVFKEIRLKANSGLYKYRTKTQIDSTYTWAEKKIEEATTYRDFYAIICTLTDFEGSTHNETSISKKHTNFLKEEKYGYFPYPIKWIDGKWRINYKNGKIPFGAEIIAINNEPIPKVISNLSKYYTTDGVNSTGKKIGMRKHFSKFYRYWHGQIENFEITFKNNNASSSEKKTVKSIGYLDYYTNFDRRHSKPMDQVYYTDLKANEKYHYKQIDSTTSILTIYDYGIGSEATTSHKTYATFLDSIFTQLKIKNIKNLIVDVRHNGGGDDPNDVLTYSYLAARDFQESKQAWISFNKIPLLKHYNINIPKFLRPLGVGKFNRIFQKRFPIKKDDKYYIDKHSHEMKIRAPKANAFTGAVYLLISPAVASAGSLFASMVAGNQNTITIGEEC